MKIPAVLFALSSLLYTGVIYSQNCVCSDEHGLNKVTVNDYSGDCTQLSSGDSNSAISFTENQPQGSGQCTIGKKSTSSVDCQYNFARVHAYSCEVSS